MKENSHVEVLSIAATRSNDPVAYVSTLVFSLTVTAKKKKFKTLCYDFIYFFTNQI